MARAAVILFRLILSVRVVPAVGPVVFRTGIAVPAGPRSSLGASSRISFVLIFLLETIAKEMPCVSAIHASPKFAPNELERNTCVFVLVQYSVARNPTASRC